MSYLVVDIETTVRNRGEGSVGSFAANPFHPSNEIVVVGWRTPEGYGTGLSLTPPEDGVVLVGHNLKFDLHYLLAASGGVKWRDWLRTGKAWDTALAEYLLSGQDHKYPSLDNCSIQYGGTVKDSELAAYWEAGVQTEDIPRDQLLAYLQGDVRNTELVYRAQTARAAAQGMEALLASNMGALLATVEMEFNGMAFDLLTATSACKTLEADLRDAHCELSSRFARALPGVTPNPSSRDQLSLVLFGGAYGVVKDVEVLGTDGLPVVYKTGARRGEVKTHKREIPHQALGLYEPKPDWATKKQGIYQTNDEVLARLPQDGLVAQILEYRRLEKEISTYYRGYSALVWADGVIHHSLEMTSTATGRLSCTKPNLQNVTGGGSDIKRCFVSRWGEDGRLLEADLSQIEVVVQAWLSNDPQMKQDVRDGVDFHCKRLAYKIGRPYEEIRSAYLEGDKDVEAQRKAVKTVSFQRAYGAGVNKIADGLGLSTGEVQEIFAAEEALYPEVSRTQQRWISEVDRLWSLSEHRTPAGLPAGTSWMSTPEGKRYVFVEDDTPEFLRRRGKLTGFRPTQIKNYAVQGFSAEILKCILNSLRQQPLDPYMLLVSTVHDSIIYDVRADRVEKCTGLLRRTIEHTPSLLKKRYGIEFDLPVRCDISVGLNWQTLDKV